MSENSMPTETQELSPIVPNVTVPPVPPKKFPILIIILLLLLGTLSIFTVYLFLEVRTLTLENTASSPSPSPTASSTADQGSEWSTYQNNKFKYSYKMPVGYIVKPFAGTQDEINEAGDYIILNQVGEEYARVTSRSEANYPSLKMVKGESINGYDSYYSTTPAGYNGDPNPYLHVELISQGTSIKFTFINRELLNSLDKQLLSTFKFIDKASSNSSQAIINAITDSVYTDILLRGDKLIQKNQIKVQIEKQTKEHAVGTVSISSGGGQVWYATYLDGHWTQIWSGQEPPTCASLSEWQYPQNFFECTK